MYAYDLMIDHRRRWGRLWSWVARHGRHANHGQSNEGEEVGELHFQKLFEVLRSCWFCYLVVLLVVVECLMMEVKGGEAGPFIEENRH
jgi:hypothetical protein